MTRLAAAAILAALVVTPASCAREGAPSPAQIRVPAKAPRDAGPSPPPTPPPSVDVRVSFFGDEGAFLGPFYDPVPDAAALVRPCFQRAREVDASVAGWLLFEVTLVRESPARITLRDASPLPEGLVSCATAALAALRSRDPLFLPPPRAAYVSLR